MIRFLGNLVALPLQLLLVIVSIVPIVDRQTLIRALWYLTRRPGYACSLILLAAQRQGIDAARQVAEQAFAICPDGSIIATIGQIELQAGFYLDRAAGWLQRARQAPALLDPDALLLFMLQLSDHIPNLSTQALVDGILSRNDLPMDLSRTALGIRAELALRQQRWAEAEDIAERILSIEDHPTGRWIFWVAAAGRQDAQEAQRQFQLIPRILLGNQYPILIANGYLYLGDLFQCHKYLRQALDAGVSEHRIRLHNPTLAEQVPYLASDSSESGTWNG